MHSLLRFGGLVTSLGAEPPGTEPAAPIAILLLVREPVRVVEWRGPPDQMALGPIHAITYPPKPHQAFLLGIQSAHPLTA